MSAVPSPDVAVSPPQYVLVAQALIDDIRRGRYPVGGLLPPEVDLSRQFGVSRHTMREAMRLLLERGLVTRQRGIGTQVKASQASPRYVQSTASIADLPQYVEETRLVTKKADDVICDEALAALLGCPPGQRWLHVRGSRYVGDGKDPIALTDIYINVAYAGIQSLIGVQKVPVYTLIEKQYGETIVEVRQQIGATVLGEVEARALNVEPGSAGLVITRRYLGSNDRVLEVAINLHPAERFSYSMSLRMKPGA
jgi:DNA-binding GntR family transcriptional regulator